MHWDQCPWKIEQKHQRSSILYDEDYEDRNVPQEEVDWRGDAKAWTISGFFEVLKQQFMSLNWIPICPHTVYSSDWDKEDMVPMLQDIYRQHGWPDLAVYRKSACLEAVQKALKENYPNELCSRGACSGYRAANLIG